jgi:hypothetical protein
MRAGSQRRPPRARPAPLLEKDLVTLQQTGLGHSPAPARGGWCVPTRPCRPDLVDPLAISSALQAGLGPRSRGGHVRCSCNAPPTLLVGAAKPDPGRRSSASQLCYASEKRLPGPLVRPEVAPGAPAAWRVSVSLTESSLTSAHPQAGLRGRPCGGRLAGRSQVYLTTGSGASTRPPTASTTGRWQPRPTDRLRCLNALLECCCVKPFSSTPLAYFGTSWRQLRCSGRPGGQPGPLVCLTLATGARAVLLESWEQILITGQYCNLDSSLPRVLSPTRPSFWQLKFTQPELASSVSATTLLACFQHVTEARATLNRAKS